MITTIIKSLSHQGIINQFKVIQSKNVQNTEEEHTSCDIIYMIYNIHMISSKHCSDHHYLTYKQRTPSQYVFFRVAVFNMCIPSQPTSTPGSQTTNNQAIVTVVVTTCLTRSGHGPAESVWRVSAITSVGQRWSDGCRVRRNNESCEYRILCSGSVTSKWPVTSSIHTRVCPGNSLSDWILLLLRSWL